jgi:hypothetical protein
MIDSPVNLSGLWVSQARGDVGPAKQRAVSEVARRSHGASGFMRTPRRTPSKSSVQKPTVFKVLLAPATCNDMAALKLSVLLGQSNMASPKPMATGRAKEPDSK